MKVLVAENYGHSMSVESSMKEERNLLARLSEGEFEELHAASTFTSNALARLTGVLADNGVISASQAFYIIHGFENDSARLL